MKMGTDQGGKKDVRARLPFRFARSRGVFVLVEGKEGMPFDSTKAIFPSCAEKKKDENCHEHEAQENGEHKHAH